MENTRSAAELDLLNVDKYLQVNNLKPVTSTAILQGERELNVDGLFSTDIFGEIGSSARLSAMGYIKLNTTVMQPFVFGLLSKMSRDFLQVLNHELYLKPVEGKMVETEEENPEYTGIAVIRQNYEACVDYFSKTAAKGEMSKTRATQTKTLKLLVVNEVFNDNWIVLPAGMRDINTMSLSTKGMVTYEPINEYYLQILRLSDSLLVANEPFINVRLHSILYDLHNFIMDNLSGKTGIIKSKSLKKPISFSSRSVITAPVASSAETFDDKRSGNIRVGEMGISLGVLSSSFYPFVVHSLRTLYDNNDENLVKIIDVNIDKPEDKNTIEKVKEFINNYTGDGKILKQVVMTFKSDDVNVDVILADWLRHYVFKDVLGERDDPKRFISSTRYPYNNIFSNQFLSPVAYTTHKTNFFKNDETGETFEITEDPQNLSDNFVPSVTTLQGMGGDFDGDKISAIGIFTDEANEAVKENSWFRHNNLNSDLQPEAQIGNEVLYGLFNLTND